MITKVTGRSINIFHGATSHNHRFIDITFSVDEAVPDRSEEYVLKDYRGRKMDSFAINDRVPIYISARHNLALFNPIGSFLLGTVIFLAGFSFAITLIRLLLF